jgi:hypothetical protein
MKNRLPKNAKMKKSNIFLSRFDKSLQEVKLAERFIVYFSLALLFIISVTYFFWVGNGIFFYQENNSLFIFSGEYLQKFIAKPGGLLEYAGNFLAQVYYNSAYGSLLISALLILLCLVFIGVNRRLSAGRSFSLLFILLPSCLLLLLQKRYDHLMHYNLGYLLVALYFLFTIVYTEKWYRLISLALFPLFFYVAGSFGYLYLGMFIIYTVVYEKGILRYLLPVFLIVIVLVTYIVFKEVLFLQPSDHLLRYPLFYNKLSRLPSFLYLLCGYIILFPWIIKTSGLFNIKKKFSGVIAIGTVLTVFPIAIFFLSRHNDPDTANLFRIEKSVYKQDWDAIIKQHESTPSTNLIGQYYYNIALSEKGQLCDRLFFGRQDFGAKSLILPRDNELINRAVYFFYTVGLINEARHLAYESMVKYGYRPENLKLLIKTELINGNYLIAERYINVMKKTLHYRTWAEKYERMLFNRALIDSDPELGAKSKLIPEKDFFVRQNDLQNIELILMTNPDNKRAFEYKMARFMFEKDLTALVNEVKKMKGMGYTHIPTHIEEAIVEYISLNREFPDLGGLTVNPKTELRYRNLGRVFNLNRGNKSRLEKEMKKEGGNTFWYYNQFK